MRLTVAALIVVLMPVLAAAQSSRSRESENKQSSPARESENAQPSRAREGEKPSALPSIGLPLPEIAPQLPTIGLSQRDEKPTARGNRKATPDHRDRGDNRGDNRGSRGHSRSRTVVVPVYVPVWDASPAPVNGAPVPGPAPVEEAPPPPAEPAPVPTGTLWLDVQPDKAAQVYVDDYYIGTTEDVGRELTLEAGPHSIELRVPGYENLAVKVRIEAGRTLVYRDTLQRTPSPVQPAQPAASAKPVEAKIVEKKPIYFIPGCYIGNVPPKDAGLPASCDQSRATTIRP